MPMTLSGRWVTAPSWVSEIDEVLLARMTSGRELVELLKDRLFDFVVFRGRLDDEVSLA